MPFEPSSIAGKPVSWLLFQDPLVAGGADTAFASSQWGPQVGVTEAAEDNVGALLPTVVPDPDPDDDTSKSTTLQIVQGGGIGRAEWCYLPGLVLDASRTEEWRGYNSELYAWGHHTPFDNSSTGSGILIYSSLYRRILAVGVRSGSVYVRTTETANDANDRPTNPEYWENLATITPEDGGASTYDHALAGCELRDGTLLLFVRKKALDPTGGSSVAYDGDYNLYRSTDGGTTWTLATRDLFRRNGAQSQGIDTDTQIRVAVSGSWIRLVYASGGLLGTLISSDDGVTWTVLGSLISDVTEKTDQTPDVMTFDLVGLDDQTGTFLLAAGNVSGPTRGLRTYTADRDGAWASVTTVSVTGNPTTRALYFVRDPYWLTLWARFHDPGDPSNGWSVYRVRRDQALVSASWATLANPSTMKGVTRLYPVHASAVWCGDRAAVIYHLVDGGTASPYALQATRALVHWIGGWTIRPFGNDYELFDSSAELLRWTYDHGEPKGGGTSATQSGWAQVMTAGGTSNWGPERLLIQTLTTGDAYTQGYTWTSPTDSSAPPQWDCASSDLYNARRNKPFQWEWVMAAGNTAPTGGSYVVARVSIPSSQYSPAGWRISIRHSTSGLIAYDEFRSTALVTLSVDLTTLDEELTNRIRLCVSPAATPNNPTGVIMHRREDGDLWTATSPFDLGQPYGAASLTQTTLLFGHVAHSGANQTISTWWREMRVGARLTRTDYGASGGWVSPHDLLGARAAGRPRSLGSGSTSTDSFRLAVAWGGGGGALTDSWTHALAHAKAAELAAGVPSPSSEWASVDGATAAGSASWIGWDAGGYASQRDYTSPGDTGKRFVHSHAAVFGLHAVSGKVEYSDNDDFSASTIAATYSSVYLTGITAANVTGSRIGLNAAGLTTIGRSNLVGHFIGPTAGAGVNRLWRIKRHEYDPDFAIHYVDLDEDGQFATTGVLSAGQTFALASDRVWLDYGQTIRARFVRVTTGLPTTNNWDGRWGISQFVPGIAWQVHPPLAWSHTDEERANLSGFRARSGAEWSREEGPTARTLVGRLLGDDREALHELRGLVRQLAGYGVRPAALLRDESRTKGQDRSLWLCTWVGDSVLDQQAYRRDDADIIRRMGDQQIELRELV